MQELLQDNIAIIAAPTDVLEPNPVILRIRPALPPATDQLPQQIPGMLGQISWPHMPEKPHKIIQTQGYARIKLRLQLLTQEKLLDSELVFPFAWCKVAHPPQPHRHTTI